MARLELYVYSCFLLVLVSQLTILVPVYAALEINTSLYQQRQDFLAAKEALANDRMQSYDSLSRRVVNYPLYGYLRYDYLGKQLHSVTDEDIRAFISTYSDSPISVRLQSKWLFDLAKRKRWKTYLEEYKNKLPTEVKSTKLYCYYLQARLEENQINDLMDKIKALWLVGKSRPKLCNPVIDYWIAQGGMTDELIWERINLAMKNRKLSLVKYLSRSLGRIDQKWVGYWLQTHRRPASMLNKKVFKQDNPRVRKILRHGIKRLARLDVEAAIGEWKNIKSTHRYTKQEISETDRSLALKAAYRNHPRAAEWLRSLDTNDDVVSLWRIRTSLANQNWPDVLSWVEKLPENKLNSDRWQYWRGRSLQEIGLKESGNEKAEMALGNFNKIANHRSYYGFLAADRLNRAYDFEIKAIKHREQELSEIMILPAITRAYELYRSGLILDARREWRYGLKNMSQRQLQLAAVLASRWGWYDRAILTVAQGRHYSDLDIRFPMAFQEYVLSSARRYQIDPAWVYGVVRQESAFMADARSSAGAMGLMQLMPGTARMTARKLKLSIRGKNELFKADKNIRLGSGYLKQMLDKNNGHQILATASYNAGPHRVKKWMPKVNAIPADIWVETIPFKETRQYVKNVMAYTTIFDKRLDGQHIPLSIRMPLISPVKN